MCTCTDNCAKVRAFFDVAIITLAAQAANFAVVFGADDCTFVDAADDGAVLIQSAHTADITSGTKVGICYGNVFDVTEG